MALVEDRDLEAAMVRFGELLKANPSGPSSDEEMIEFEDAVLNISAAARALILKSWDIRLPVLDQKRTMRFSISGSHSKRADYWTRIFSRHPD